MLVAEKLLLIFLCMIMAHIVDDYYLQGILAKLKQKEWWHQNAPDPMYGRDYIVALIAHAFSWSFCIMAPCVIAYGFHWMMLPLFALNVALHSLIDDMKANKKEINLIEDQVFHLVQILATFLTCSGLYA